MILGMKIANDVVSCSRNLEDASFGDYHKQSEKRGASLDAEDVYRQCMKDIETWVVKAGWPRIPRLEHLSYFRLCVGDVIVQLIIKESELLSVTL